MDLTYAEELRLIDEVGKAFQHRRQVEPQARAVIPGVPLVHEGPDFNEIEDARRRLSNAERKLREFRDAN
jgi:hypothetical protein